MYIQKSLMYIAEMFGSVDSNRWSVWLQLRASLYEAQIGLGARLVSAKLPPPPPRAPH